MGVDLGAEVTGSGEEDWEEETEEVDSGEEDWGAVTGEEDSEVEDWEEEMGVVAMFPHMCHSLSQQSHETGLRTPRELWPQHSKNQSRLGYQTNRLSI